MTSNDLIINLSKDETVNEALAFLNDIVVDKRVEVIEKLRSLISTPTKISNTNQFASILSELPSDLFIESLVSEIMKGIPYETKWLGDYMYALDNVLEESDNYYESTNEFVELLGKWLFDKPKNEISWKAGILLAHINNSNSLPFLILGANNHNLFHLTRIACIRGIVNHFKDQAKGIIEPLSDDTNIEVKEATLDALEWLRNS